MKFLSISSGSKGNASFIETGNIKALIDVGVSYTEIKRALAQIEVNIDEITHVFITHEHNDHIKGLKMLLKHHQPQIYLTKGTNNYLNVKEPIIIKALESLLIEDLSVLPIPLSHDANEPVGFIFKANQKSICYITDTGYILNELSPLLKNHDLYYLEFNHDPYTLIHSKRPYYLIRRIMNEKGHLSNEDASYYFAQFLGENTKYLIYAHMSEECNSVGDIEHTFNEVLNAQGVHQTFKRYFAKANTPLELIVL